MSPAKQNIIRPEQQNLNWLARPAKISALKSLILVTLLPLTVLTAPKVQAQANNHPWSAEILADFEAVDPAWLDKWIIRGNKQAFTLFISKLNPAPIAQNKSSLCLMYRHIPKVSLFLLPYRQQKELATENFIHELSFWALGNGDRTTVTIILSNARGGTQQVSFPALEFKGWRKVKKYVQLFDGQMNQVLAKSAKISIKGLLIRPQVSTRTSEARQICFDQISVLTRPKFLDIPLKSLDQ